MRSKRASSLESPHPSESTPHLAPVVVVWCAAHAPLYIEIMEQKKYTIVGLGELLWDVFPTKKQLGGAPANFSYMAHLLGDEGAVFGFAAVEALAPRGEVVAKPGERFAA